MYENTLLDTQQNQTLPTSQREGKTLAYIADVKLIEAEPASDLTPTLLSQDKSIALRDLKELGTLFQPLNDDHGPYKLELSIADNRLIFHIENAKGHELPYLVLSLKPYRRLIKDYFIIVNSYDEAVREGKPSRVEAIDMGRRGLHNEGAELLQERLKDKIDLGFDTARLLFTLICALHAGKTHIMR